MIDVFLPERIGSYYLLPKRILGFDFSKTFIYAAQIYLSGNEVVIEKFFQEAIDTNSSTPYQERVSGAIQKIIEQANQYDKIITALSSAVVLFKELQLPFTDPQKISMVINFEIESYLPFSLDEALIDFIITKVDQQEQKSHIMVAAVQKQYVAEHLAYFEGAHLAPEKITVDLFDLYGLYRSIPTYIDNLETVTLIDIEFNVTRIAFIVNKQLKLIRTLPKGIGAAAKKIGHELSISNGQSLEYLIRFGINKHDEPNYDQVAEKALTQFFEEIAFTLQSFSMHIKTTKEIDQILLLGRGSEINGIAEFASKILTLPCQLFDSNELLKLPHVTLKHTTRIPRANAMSLATVFPSGIMQYFNLRKGAFALSDAQSFNKLFFTTIGLVVTTLGLLIGFGYWQQRILSHTATTMEKSVINKFNQMNLTESKSYTKALEEAEEKINAEEELWFSFSRQQRFSFLKTLQDLSIAIDRKAIGLNLKKLILTSNDVTFEGDVKGFDELKVLERELKESNLFTNVPTLQELKVSEKLTLKKNGEESS